MSDKSGFPWRAATEIDDDVQKYIAKAGTPIENVAALGSSPTNAEIATVFNALRDALIAGGKMMDS